MATITHDQPFLGNPRKLISVDANETTPWYVLARGQAGCVSVRPTSGTIRAESTEAPEEVVDSDNANGTSNAIAIPWVHGNVSAAINLDFSFTTAVRFVSIGAGGGGTASIAE